MSNLMSLLLRAWEYGKTRINADYADGVRLFQAGMKCTMSELEQLQMHRLRTLLSTFAGLDSMPPQLTQAAGSLAGYPDLRKLPVLTRAGLHQLTDQLGTHYNGRRDIHAFATGGSTGEPVRFMLSDRQRCRAAGIRRQMDRLLGWQPGMPRFALWRANLAETGHRDDQPNRRPFRRQLPTSGSRYFGGFIPSPDDYRRFCTAVRRRPGCAIWGYGSALEDCARLLLAEQQALPAGHVAAAWNCGEMMYEPQKETVRQAFGIRPRELYASRECSGIAMECAAGSLHISPRYIVEAVDPDTGQQLPAGQVGELLISDLFNDALPVVRYALGDLGAVEWRACACGRNSWCLSKLSGRATWLIELPSGRKLSTGIFAAIAVHIPALHQWTVVRRSPAEFEVHYAGSPLTAAQQAELLASLATTLEGAQISIVHTPDLPRAPSGKLLQFVDLLPADQPATARTARAIPGTRRP